MIYFYKEIKYENGAFKIYLIKEPDWEISSVAIDFMVYDVDHESFLLDMLDYLLCGIKSLTPSAIRDIVSSMLSPMTGVYLLRE